MNHIISLGAKNKITGEYVYPKIADKNEEYYCPDCEKDIIICKGKIIRPYFRHKADDDPCSHYNNPTESQIHKEGKLLIKTLLEKKTKIIITRNCYNCKQIEETEIPEISELSKIKLEYRFEYNGLKIADVAYINNDKIISIFEIYNTHRTEINTRPEPWYEINAMILINLANEKNNIIKIPCTRCEKCTKCKEKEKRKEEIIKKLYDKYNNKCDYCKNECINLKNNTIELKELKKQLKNFEYENEKIYHKHCYILQSTKEICKSCNNLLQDDIIDKNILYHKDCYKIKLLEDYKLGCGYCKEEIINKNMGILEIIDKIKDTSPFNKYRITYHYNCLSEKIENDKNSI